MKRRELIKTSLLGLSASMLGLAGCKKEESVQTAQCPSDDFKIVPKRTGIYEFSVPLPFNFDTIDRIAKLNTKLTKSKVTSFYNGAVAPLSNNFNHWVHLNRGNNDNIKTYDDFFKYVDYARNRGFDFTYLMNSPKSFSMRDLDTFRDEFLQLLDLLIKHGVKNIKVANVQVATIINDHAPNKFMLSASCAFEYKNINQYQQLFILFPNFDLIDMAYDENQNFKLIKSLKDSFPSVKLELMINETCIKGCAMRASCIPEIEFVSSNCQRIHEKMEPINYFVKTGFIYPWALKYYSAIGVNNFKYVALGSNGNNFRDNYHNISNLKAYLSAVELEDENYGDLTAYDFFSKIFDNRAVLNSLNARKMKHMKIGKLIEYLPNVEHFVKHGSECSYKCEKQCTYCYNCAKKLQEILS